MGGYASPRAVEMAVKEAARRSPMDTNRAISGFYFHRLLCRVFSELDSPFVLKGGLSALARTTDARYTRDIDLTTNSLDIDAAVDELKILVSKDLNDFVSFEYANCSPIKAEDEYREGRTVTFDVFLGAKRVQTVSVDLVADEIDCGKSDRISPADRIELIDIESYDYLVYPAEKAVADKVCGIVERHGDRPSSRVKDLVDIVVYARNVAFDFDVLSVALSTELSARKLTLQRAFSLPPEWGDAQARQYTKLARQAVVPDRFRNIFNAEMLTKELIEPCLSGQAGLKIWNTEALTWN
ncbi:nucleotidyl transferase AbiEii/AbiGii toxin family protein [Eggerthella sp. YY7918]|uniref:nucleotidyl transferase AbiEii/AbiGii toxin family protein n=1 Tax=Eggerthella sp. (strain YY7918) TaxID=502558 RepID=UPI0002171860|nr:nucleotidyl transferase AbiEii/AbiGii toxin family protein [Eggerthella sp. YY7918]BAK45663.1 hypothetical protein EGYY_26640 [Eggerthella sp. YY7918]